MKKRKIKKEELRKIKASEKISIKEGCGAGVMEGFGNKYIIPYALDNIVFYILWVLTDQP